MERQDGFWAGVEQAFHHLLSPFRISSETLLGYSPPDIQIWVFLVAAFMFLLAAPGTYGDIVLMRRSVRTTGKVVRIDEGSSDGPDTPIIDFRDASGRLWTFESELGCNAATRRIGASVPVIYDPLNPKRAREDGRRLSKIWRFAAWHAFIVGLLIIGTHWEMFSQGH